MAVEKPREKVCIIYFDEASKHHRNIKNAMFGTDVAKSCRFIKIKEEDFANQIGKYPVHVVLTAFNPENEHHARLYRDLNAKLAGQDVLMLNLRAPKETSEAEYGALADALKESLKGENVSKKLREHLEKVYDARTKDLFKVISTAAKKKAVRKAA
ncbi:MAG: hypothetical protein V1834_01290 [Candidatus Micrarchaeota archaeon]